MDIENIGEALVDQLVDSGLVKTFADLYRLTDKQLIELERMGEKSAANVVEGIAQSRNRTLDRLLAALGIRHVGNRGAYVLASHFGSLDALAAATTEQLSAVHEIGDVIAQSVHDFFHSPAGQSAVEALKSTGVNPTMPTPDRTAARPLEGKTIVITGTLPTLQRKEAEDLITAAGGKPSSSVSKKTSFVVAGENAGSKLDKAKELGVEVVDEAELLRRAGKN
jgi:DNA ligase (NAD+)